jgi:hypothetical protein
MNERIKELAEQANLKLDELSDDTFIPLENFAELIVKECIKINKEELSFNAFERLVNKYQEHFYGVKL